MRYEFHPAALEEYRQVALWYAEREPQVAIKFVSSVEDAIARIVEAPQRWRVVDRSGQRVTTTFEKSSTQSLAVVRDFGTGWHDDANYL